MSTHLHVLIESRNRTSTHLHVLIVSRDRTSTHLHVLIVSRDKTSTYLHVLIVSRDRASTYLHVLIVSRDRTSTYLLSGVVIIMVICHLPRNILNVYEMYLVSTLYLKVYLVTISFIWKYKLESKLYL